jgi:hypothetical protein
MNGYEQLTGNYPYASLGLPTPHHDPDQPDKYGRPINHPYAHSCIGDQPYQQPSQLLVPIKDPDHWSDGTDSKSGQPRSQFLSNYRTLARALFALADSSPGKLRFTCQSLQLELATHRLYTMGGRVAVSTRSATTAYRTLRRRRRI